MAISNEPVTNQAFLYINQMIASRASATTLNITSGICRDSTNVYDINVGNYLGVNPNLSANTATTVNIAVNGVNGLDTGTVAASTMYAIHAITDPQGRPLNQPAYLLSLSATAPLIPQGYGAFRLVGWWPTNGSSQFPLAYVEGTGTVRSFRYDAVVATAVTAGNATSYTAVDLTASVPAVNNSSVRIKSATTPSAAGRGVFMQGVNATGDEIVILGQVTSVVINSYDDVTVQLTSGAPKINYKVSNSSDAVALSVSKFNYSL